MSAVRDSADADFYEYTLQNLGKGVPPTARAYPLLSTARQMLQMNLVNLYGSITDLPKTIQRMRTALEPHVAALRLQQAREQVQKLLRKEAEDKEVLELLLREIAGDDEDTLAQKMADLNPFTRLLAAQTAGTRRLHLEANLIQRLDDPELRVREAAHQALVRISRGADFGPAVKSGPKQWARAIDDWQTWLALQESAATAALAELDPQVAAPQKGPAPEEKK